MTTDINCSNDWLSDWIVGSEAKETIARSRKVGMVRQSESKLELDFRNKVAFEFASIPEVQAVFTSEVGKYFYVWTVVKKRDHDVYKKLYEKERQLIDANQRIDFDFTIMPSQGHDPGALVTDSLATAVFVRQ